MGLLLPFFLRIFSSVETNLGTFCRHQRRRARLGTSSLYCQRFCGSQWSPQSISPRTQWDSGGGGGGSEETFARADNSTLPKKNQIQWEIEVNPRKKRPKSALWSSRGHNEPQKTPKRRLFTKKSSKMWFALNERLEHPFELAGGIYILYQSRNQRYTDLHAVSRIAMRCEPKINSTMIMAYLSGVVIDTASL